MLSSWMYIIGSVVQEDGRWNAQGKRPELVSLNRKDINRQSNTWPIEIGERSREQESEDRNNCPQSSEPLRATHLIVRESFRLGQVWQKHHPPNSPFWNVHLPIRFCAWSDLMPDQPYSNGLASALGALSTCTPAFERLLYLEGWSRIWVTVKQPDLIRSNQKGMRRGWNLFSDIFIWFGRVPLTLLEGLRGDGRYSVGSS